jgi:hypothetical protein
VALKALRDTAVEQSVVPISALADAATADRLRPAGHR